MGALSTIREQVLARVSPAVRACRSRLRAAAAQALLTASRSTQARLVSGLAAVAVIATLAATLIPGPVAEGQVDVAVHAKAPAAGLSAVAPLVQVQSVKALLAAARRAASLAQIAKAAELDHRFHLEHLAHLVHLTSLRAQAASAVAASVTAQQLPVQHSSSGDGDSDADDSTSDAESGASAPAAPSAPQQAPSVPQQPAYSSGGSYSCSGLESLWVQAGGSSSAAFTAAEIAMAESGGNPNAVSPTNDYGLWQINGSHGSMATFSPMGNARAAVSISGDGSNWSPWTTYTSGAYQGKCSGSVSTTAQITPDRVVSAPSRSSSAAATAYAWALTQEGKWYSYGTAGPSTYDCSGLVMDAYQHAGIDLLRTTYGMLASAHLVRESVPHQGDLAFYSSGHVELYAYSGTTFGAHSSGQQVGFIHEWTTPEYYAVR